VNEGSIYVNASSYVPGMYVVRMVDADNKINSQKIIKKQKQPSSLKSSLFVKSRLLLF
jgi:hypothetical protein